MKHTVEREDRAFMHSLIVKKSAKKELDRLTDQIFEKIDTATIVKIRHRKEVYRLTQTK